MRELQGRNITSTKARKVLLGNGREKAASWKQYRQRKELG